MSMKINVHGKGKNEDRAAYDVLQERKRDAMERIDSLKDIVSGFKPSEDETDRSVIGSMDYLLESLDNVIKDAKDVAGLF